MAADGKVHVDRVVAVIACGTIVNPDTVVAQMQSGIIFGISAVLWGRSQAADQVRSSAIDVSR